MTITERYIKLLASEARRHGAAAKVEKDPVLRKSYLDMEDACLAGASALRREVERRCSCPTSETEKPLSQKHSDADCLLTATEQSRGRWCGSTLGGAFISLR